MLKRLSALIAIFMTVSILLTPLASTQQAPDITAAGETVEQVAPAIVSEPEMVVSAQPGQSAPPTVLDPLPSFNLQDEVPFELISVIRSCEDQTRFDLSWEGTGQIVSMTYVLFNSSDNVNTEGQIMPEELVNTSATILGRPGDTALSVGVTLVTGEQYGYLADASECGNSQLSVTATPINQPNPPTSRAQSTEPVVAQGTTVGSLAVTLDSGHPDVVLAGVIVELYDMNGTLVQSNTTDEAGVVIFVDVPAGDYEVVPRVSAPFVEERVTVTLTADMQTQETIVVAHSQGAFVTFSYQPPIEVTEGFVTLSLVNGNGGFNEQYDLAIGEQTIIPLPAGTYEFQAVFHDSNKLLRFPNTTIVVDTTDMTFDIAPALTPAGSLAVTVVTSGMTFVPEGVEVELLLNGNVEQTAVTDRNGVARFALVEARTDYTARVHAVGTFPTFTSEQFAVNADVENSFTLRWASSVQGEEVVFHIDLQAVADDQWFQFAIYDENQNYVNGFTYNESGTFTETLELPAGTYSYYTLGDRYYRVSGVEFTVTEGEVTTVSIRPEVRPWETVTFVLDLQSSHDMGEFYVSIEDAEEDFDIYEGFAVYGSGLFYRSVSLPAGTYTYSTSTYYDWQRYETVSDVQFEVKAGGNNSVTITPELRPSETVTFEVNLQADAEEQGLTLFVYDERGRNYETLNFSSGGAFQRSLVLPVGTYTYRAFGVPYEPILNGEFSVESGMQNVVSITPTEIPHESVTFTIDMQVEAEYQYLSVSVYDEDGYRRGNFSVDGSGTHTRTLQLPAGSYTYGTSSSQYNELWDVPFMVEVGGANSVAITPVPNVVTEETGTVTFIVDLQGEGEDPRFTVNLYDANRYNRRGSLNIDQYGTVTKSIELRPGTYIYDAYGIPYQGSYGVSFVVEAGEETTISLTPNRAPVETVMFEVDLHANVDNQYLSVTVHDEFGNWFGNIRFYEAGIHTGTLDLPVGKYTYSVDGTPYRNVSGVLFEVKSGEGNKLEIRPELAPWGVVTFSVVLTAPPSSEHYFSLDITTEEGYYVNSFDFDDPGTFSFRHALRPGSYTYSTRGFPYASQADVAFVVAENGEITFTIQPTVPESADVTVRGVAPDDETVYLYVYDDDDLRVAREYHYQETTLQLPIGEYMLLAEVGYYSDRGYQPQEIRFTVTAAGPNLVELAPFERYPMVSFTVTNENDVPVDQADIVIRNGWGGQVRTVHVDDSGTAQTYLPLGTYTYTISAPSKYQLREGGTISHTADGTAVDIVLTELPNSDLTISFGFQDVPARPTNAELRNGAGELVATIRVPQQATSVLVRGVPHGDDYTVTVLKSEWYPEQKSDAFPVTSAGPSTFLFNLSALELIQVDFEYVPESGRDLPQSPSLQITPVGTTGNSKYVWLAPDTRGVHRGSIQLPAGRYDISPAWNNNGYLQMDSFQMDLTSTASPVTQVLTLKVAEYGQVVFDLAPVAGLLWPEMFDTITISQDGTQVNGTSITWESGTPTTWPVFLAPGVYQWQLITKGPAGALSGEFEVIDSDITIPVQGQSDPNGVVVLTTTFPADSEEHPATVAGTVTLRPADGSHPAITRRLNDLSEVVVGPVEYGDYLLSVTSSDPRYVFEEEIAFSVASPEHQLTLEWLSTGAPGVETYQYTFTVQPSEGGPAPVNPRIWFSPMNSPSRTSHAPDENGIITISITSREQDYWYAYATADNYGTVEVPLPELPGTETVVILNGPKSRIEVSVINEDAESLAGIRVTLSCTYGGSGVSDENGIAVIYEDMTENESCSASARDPMSVHVPLYDNFQFRWKSESSPNVVVTMIESKTAVHNIVFEIRTGNSPLPEGETILIVNPIDGGTSMMTTGPDGTVTVPSMEPGSYSIRVPLLVDNRLTWAGGGPVQNIAKTVTVESTNQTIVVDVTRDDYATVTFNVVTSDGGPIPAGIVLRSAIYGKGSTTYSDSIPVTEGPIVLNLTTGYYNLIISESGRYRAVTYRLHANGDMEVTLTLQRITAVGGPTIVLSEREGRAGSSITVAGSGYAPDAELKIRWGIATGPELATVTTERDGTFSRSITIPSIAAIGSYDIVAIGTNVPNASAKYKVTQLATVNVVLEPASGQAGATPRVTGSGFRPNETVTFRWNSPTGPVLGSRAANDQGVVSASIKIPAIATVDSFSIHAVGTSGQSGSATYEVTALATVNVNLSITTGRAGSITAVMGNGFLPGETVTIRWGSPTGPSLGSVMVSPSGTISGKVTVPPTATVGQFAIHATGGTSKQTGSANYQVSALAVVKVSLSITTGRAGSITAVMGSGFQPGETVTIRWGGASGTVLGAVKASPTGTISGKVTIPKTAQLGVFSVYIFGGTSKQVGSARYTVNRLVAASIQLSPASGRAGTTTTVTGSGFRPGETVTIRWGGASGPVLGSVKATSTGTFSGKIVVPKNATLKAHAVYVSGGTSRQVGVAAYTVTQAAAVAPGRQHQANGWIMTRS